MLARWVPIAALLALALGSGWLLKKLDVRLFEAAATKRHTPDFYMENFTTITMDEFGKPRRRIVADYMAHFPDTDTKEFSRPYMIL